MLNSDLIFYSSVEHSPTRLVNSFALVADGWDDFDYKLRFDLIFYDSSGFARRIGKTKILHKRESHSGSIERKTDLDNEFSELGDGYISLGQEQGYYTKLRELLGEGRAVAVLRSLRDIAELPGLAHDFEAYPAFRNGMIRENSAQQASRFGGTWVRGDEAHTEPAFAYNLRLGGSSIATECQFRFSEKSKLPSRIVAIIGKNAVGKTALLSTLAADLAQIGRISAKTRDESEARFPSGRPLFSRVIAISYSAFDKFSRPEAAAHSSYVYCGIRNERGQISNSTLTNGYSRNIKRVRDLNRGDEWIDQISGILGDNEILTKSMLESELDGSHDGEVFGFLSSGQAILIHFVTAIIAWVQPNSIVLFDEPETHLHPNAVASLFISLSSVLRSYRSFALVATHSPIVLQEIHSACVVVFTREGPITVAELLSVESFGESITELTRHVFRTMEVPSLYKEVLGKLAKAMTPEEVLNLFSNELGLSAQAYLLSQYEKNKRK